jgi:hypothetical protein
LFGTSNCVDAVSIKWQSRVRRDDVDLDRRAAFGRQLGRDRTDVGIHGVASLEDGLYVLDGKPKDPAFVARAAMIVLAADASGSATQEVWQRHIENVANLITKANTPNTGYRDPAA